MKRLVLLIFSIFAADVYGQDLKEFYGPVFTAETKLQALASFNIGDGVTSSQLQGIFSKSGIQINLASANKILKAIDVLEDDVIPMSVKAPGGIQIFFQNAGFPISIAEAQDIADHFSAGPKKGQNSHVYVMALFGKKVGAKLLAFIEEIIQESQRPSRPDSPTSISIKRVVKRGLQLQRIMMPRSSGDDWLGEAYAQVNTTYVSYDDELANGSGKEKGLSMVLGGELNEKMSLSFGLGRSRNHRGGENKSTSTSYGGDVMVHYKFNDNYGLGAYTFYQETDIEDYNSNAYGYGGGMVFSTWHDFEYFYVSTAHSVTRTFYEYGNDTLYVGALWIGKDWTDSFATAFTLGFVDSLTSSVTGDNTYWTMGGEVSYIVNEKVDLIIGYEKTLALDDYKSDLFQLGLTWKF
ncbi:MAG: hypothetical protein NE330_08710 [Lentisphaeraceae bacterium]|nr:hypothetical protein [Lentisphaeraceae bacterium]